MNRDAFKKKMINLALVIFIMSLLFFGLAQTAVSEDENDVELEYFSSELCGACKEKEHIITEIQENYSKQITLYYYSYEENQELYNEYGFNGIPSAVVTNKTNGLYTLIPYAKFDRETIESAIIMHLEGNYNISAQSQVKDASSNDLTESFDLKTPVIIITVCLDIFLLIFLFLKRDLIPKKNLKIILSLVIASLLIITAVNIPYNQNIKNNTIESLVISQDDKLTMLNYSYKVLEDYFTENTQEPNNYPDLSLNYNYDKLYITLFQNGTLVGCNSGSTNTDADNRVYSDIYQAMVECIEDDTYAGVSAITQIPFIDIVVSFLYNKTEAKRSPLRYSSYNIELGIDAVEVEKDAHSASYTEGISIINNYDLNELLQRLCLKNDLEYNCYASGYTDVYKYDTVTFKKDSKGGLVDLYRYNILINAEDISPQGIYESLSISYDWYLNNINPESNLLQYEYYPSWDGYSSDNSNLRRIASIWALTVLKDFLVINDSSSLVNYTLNYYLNFKQTTDNYSYININGDSKIANNAFLILTLINTPDYPERNLLLTELAEGILAMQQEDGSFNTYFTYNSSSGIDYYPGECLLSLMMLYKNNGNESYLESVEKAFYYYKTYWQNNKNTAFIPWHTQAYKLLYEETNDSEIADFIFEMNDWILNYQVQNSAYPDEIGGFFGGTPTTTASCYMEGVNDALTVARYVNDTDRIERYSNSIKNATKFILQTQFTEENSFYLTNKSRAIGGFKYSLVDNRIRNDFVQHSVGALIKAYSHYLEFQK